MAEEITDTLYEDKEQLVRQLVLTKLKSNRFYGRGYEFKSKTRVLGMPLVHILYGHCFKPCVAKGIIAIGDISVGGVAIGGLSCGVVSIGGVAAGIFSLGGLSLAVVAALGGFALGGLFAFGGAAISTGLAIGGLAVGRYAFGGAAFARDIAVGGYANATIAIGNKTKGLHTFLTSGGTSIEQIRMQIKQSFPDLPNFIYKLIMSFAESIVQK